MLNTFSEEQLMSDRVLNFHEKIMQSMEIPAWMNVKCPFCGKEQPLRSIRSFSIKLNARNIGDLALEILCVHCNKMDTLYFRGEIEKISDCISFLTGEKSPKSSPILEEKMYKLAYNNVVGKMMNNKEVGNDNK